MNRTIPFATELNASAGSEPTRDTQDDTHNTQLAEVESGFHRQSKNSPQQGRQKDGGMSTLTPINQADQSFLTIEHVAEELHQTTEWVESKCRRRCSNPIPFHNVGNHRLFVWSEVFNWVTSSPKIIHSRHPRRTKEEIDAVRKAKGRKTA